MKLGKISTSQLTTVKRSSLGLLAVGVYFALIPLIMLGSIDYPNLILGLTFVACALITAHEKPLVLSGLMVSFIGIVNLLAISNVFSIDSAWMLAAICVVILFLFEFTSLKFGKATAQAKYAVLIPMTSLFLMFLLALAGWNPVLYVDYATQLMKWLNYVALMFLTGVMSFEALGWKLMKKNQGLWIAVLALFAIVTSFVGAYSGTLSW